MGESTCLRRSFSNPSSTVFSEFKEGDPIRALTESVSFGRFVSDSLQWEKWSAFSSNRYLEEAERFSKPGSVAQKKAFFEAHYRRKQAAKHASLQVEEVVALEPGDSSEDGKEDSKEQEEPSMQSAEIAEVDNRSTIENHGTDSSSVEIDCHANVTDESREVVELAEPAVGKEDDLLPHHACLCEDLHVSETEEARNKSADSRSEISPDNGTVDRYYSDSHEGKELKLSTTTSTPDKTLNPTLPIAPASSKPKTADNAAGNGRKSSLKRIEEMRIPPRPRLLHMSINLDSAGGLSKSWKTRGFKFPSTSKEMLYSTSIGNKPKVPVCIAPKKSLGARSTDVKRTVSILSKSTTALMRMKTDKKPNPVHSSYSKCTTIAETRARPATVCAAFGLRSAERAEKRKEFFLKQQERIMAKEVERHQLVQRSQPSLERPQQRSPKLSSNLGNNKGLDARSRPSWHVSVVNMTTNQASSKACRRTTTYSSSHPRKHVQENASSNIPVKKCHWPSFDNRNVPSS